MPNTLSRLCSLSTHSGLELPYETGLATLPFYTKETKTQGVKHSPKSHSQHIAKIKNKKNNQYPNQVYGTLSRATDAMKHSWTLYPIGYPERGSVPVGYCSQWVQSGTGRSWLYQSRFHSVFKPALWDPILSCQALPVSFL